MHIFSWLGVIVRRALVTAAGVAAVACVTYFGPLPSWAVFAVLGTGVAALAVVIAAAARTELTVSWEPAPEPVILPLPAPPAGRRRALPAGRPELGAGPQVPPPAGRVVVGTVLRDVREGEPR